MQSVPKYTDCSPLHSEFSWLLQIHVMNVLAIFVWRVEPLGFDAEYPVEVHGRFGRTYCLHLESRSSVCVWFLLFTSLFDPEEGSSTVLLNVGEFLSYYTVSHPRRLYSSYLTGTPFFRTFYKTKYYHEWCIFVTKTEPPHGQIRWRWDVAKLAYFDFKFCVIIAAVIPACCFHSPRFQLVETA
jgi:hypothetical protein